MKEQTVAVLKSVWKELEFAFNGADWRQESYRQFLFEAFAKVYDIEPMHGDQVKKFICEQCLNPQDSQHKEKLRSLCEFCNTWSEWLYAWDKVPKMYPITKR